MYNIPLINGQLHKGPPYYKGQVKWSQLTNFVIILTIHFEPPKRGQPLYKGQDVWSQGACYMEVPLYMYTDPKTYMIVHVHVELYTVCNM